MRELVAKGTVLVAKSVGYTFMGIFALAFFAACLILLAKYPVETGAFLLFAALFAR